MRVRRELKCRVLILAEVVDLFGWQLDEQVLRLEAPIVAQGVLRARSQRQTNLGLFELRANIVFAAVARIGNEVVLIDDRYAGRCVDECTVKGETESAANRREPIPLG